MTFTFSEVSIVLIYFKEILAKLITVDYKLRGVWLNDWYIHSKVNERISYEFGKMAINNTPVYEYESILIIYLPFINNEMQEIYC